MTFLAAGPLLRVICAALTVYWVILFVRIIMSWFPPPPSGPLRAVFTLVRDVTDPVLKPLQRAIPPVRAGMMAIDFSPIVVFVILAVLRSALGC